MRKNSKEKTTVSSKNDYDKPKIINRRYHVTSQTAYHIRELALSQQTTEGHIIDKLMRNYLAERREIYNKGV